MINILQDYNEPQALLAKLALMGTAIGDAFGQCFFNTRPQITQWLSQKQLPPAPWYFTDDTIMTIGLVQHLLQYNDIQQDKLAHIWATNYQKDISRGYGGTAHKILREISEGRSWQEAASEVFSGMGSMGNGAAMRVVPLGAFYPENISHLVEQACLSAQITHAHPEAQAGAVAIAVAAHLAAYTTLVGNDWLEQIAAHTPPGDTHNKILKSLTLPSSYRVETIVHALGNGHQMLAQDTVPLVLWCVAHHFDDFAQALWKTVSALGDRDTTCAMAGGIMALRLGWEGIPQDWGDATEPIDQTWLV
ncbi:MAG TPA: crystallin J1 [Microscillaceae bacterium]|nr:crystallin J1 [Microscillaceae bacterium]